MKKRDAEGARLAEILGILDELHGPPSPGLSYRSPWELLVATLLSAQCTDARVNMVTPSLFKAYPTPEALAKAGQEELEEVIRSIGLFRNKAKNLIELAKIVSTTYGGVVPGVREALEALPGVGRKTASVALAQGFGVPAFAVDTHVGRVSRRLGFTKSDDPVKVEQAMTALLKPEKWASAHLTLIRHGRTVCKAPKPLCESCPVIKLCPYPKSADAR